MSFEGCAQATFADYCASVELLAGRRSTLLVVLERTVPDCSHAPTVGRLRCFRGIETLTAAYHVLNRGVPYHELGEDFFYRRDTEATERYRRRLVRQLERLGHQVTLEPLPEAA